MQETSFDSEGIIRFLEWLLEVIEGHLIVIWDGAPIHRSQAIKDFLASGAAARLRLERLPGYAPELNPIELIWRYLKHVELKNLCCRDIDHLWEELTAAITRVDAKDEVTDGCIEHVGYIS